MTEDPKILDEGFWIPDLEIYGLENFSSKSVLKQMAGLRIKKNKEIEYNVKYVRLLKSALARFPGLAEGKNNKPINLLRFFLAEKKESSVRQQYFSP